MREARKLPVEQREELFRILKERFEKNMQRHGDIKWERISARLEARPERVWSLNEMENSGGEPDVVGYDEQTDEFIFFDCAAESPTGRRSACYDRAAQLSRKTNSPDHNAVEMAAQMGIELLSEEQYRTLQRLGEFDTKTSSWVKTPTDVRERGGALFCDRRYGRVFTYHNGAQSYYAARGFRGFLRV